MAEQPRMSAETLTTLSTWLPDDLTPNQMDRVIQAAAYATDRAFREGWSSCEQQVYLRRMAVPESHDSGSPDAP